MSEERIQALRRALEVDPENHALRLLLCETLEKEGRTAEALEEYARLLDAGALSAQALPAAGELALQCGQVELASRFLQAAKQAGAIEGVATLEQGLERALSERGVLRLVRGGKDRTAAPPAAEKLPTILFSDIGGLHDAKKAIHRMIVLPFRRQDLFRKYGRDAGGAVLFYGAPGCGKTMLARATAGECGVPFLNIRIEEILDPWFGVAERNLHDAFEEARRQAPCVLFIDELDAIGFARRKMQGSGGRALVDQLLQELDAIGSDNRTLLVMGATNAPWDVDDALKRPGRFDRVTFVPPPDETARAEILTNLLSRRPTAGISIERLAHTTPLFSGADLEGLVERAVDRVIDEALESNSEPPLGMHHLEATLAEMRPTTLDWLARARNHVEFANQDRRYDDVAAFLRSREARSWKS